MGSEAERNTQRQITKALVEIAGTLAASVASLPAPLERLSEQVETGLRNIIGLADDSRQRLEVEAMGLKVQTETLRVLTRIAAALEVGADTKARIVRNPIGGGLCAVCGVSMGSRPIPCPNTICPHDACAGSTP